MKPNDDEIAIANEWSGKAIGAAIEVHRHLGPGLLESAYQACFCRELEMRGIPFQFRLPMPLDYKGLRVEKAYEIDVLIAGTVVVELKSVEKIAPVFEAQLLTYLRLSNL